MRETHGSHFPQEQLNIRKLPVTLFAPCDAPGIPRYPNPEGEACIPVLLCTKWPFFSGIVYFSRLDAGLFSCFLLRGPQRGGADSTVQALDPAGLRDTCSRWSKSRDPASNSGDGLPLPKSHPRAWKPTRVFVFFKAHHGISAGR